ncbi:MAG: insulinase family protein [Proteiniphilum sp.]|nr:insulinase family protein [Proteiniphilum sp.]
MHSIKYTVLTFILLIFSFSAFAGDIQTHPKLIKGNLRNGLTYYIYPNDYPRGEAVYRLFIKSGSVNEEEGQRGLAHFLEHMAFNGTRTFPGNELVSFLESKGAKFGRDLNAHTSYNETVYKLKLPSTSDGMVDTTITILADWLDGLLLEEDEIDAERGVILSEWLSKRKPESEVNDMLLSELMNNSIYDRRKVIGDTAVIQHFQYETLRNYYESWYQPNLAAIAVVGDVDPAKVEAMIIQKFSTMKNVNANPAETHPIPDYDAVDVKVLINKDLKKADLTLIQLIPHSDPVRNESDYYPYLERALINRLFRNRLNALSFTNDAYAKGSIGISDFLNTKGILMASVELMPNKIEEGVSAFSSHMNQIYQYGFLPEEIERVKKGFIRSKERNAITTQPVSSSQLMEEIYADFFKEYAVTTPQEEYRLAKKYIGQIDSLSLVNRLHNLVDMNRVHYIFSSFEENNLSDSLRLLAAIDSLQRRTIDPYRLEIDVPGQLLAHDPQPGSIVSEREIPAIGGIELQLSNGVKVIYKESVSSKNRISMSAYKPGGLYALDSVQYVNGIFAPSVISLSGAGDFSRDEISYYLAGNSASARLLIENSRAGMVAGASAEDIETMFQLMYLRWTEPRADSAVFEMTRKRSIENYRNRNVTDQSLYYRDLNYLMRGKDYVTSELTDSVVEEQVSLDQMVPLFHQSFGNANGFTFVILSDLELEQLTPYITRYIASLPALPNACDTPYRYDGGKIETQARKFVRAAGDADRGVVSLIFQHTDLAARKNRFDLMSDLASGVLRMKLLSELREKMGMVYSVSVSSGSREHPSPLVRNTISFSTNPENCPLLIDAVKEILSEMSQDPASFQNELENVKKSLVNDMEVNLQKDSFWSSFIRNSTFNDDEEWGFIPNYQEIMNDISNDDLSRFLSHYYHPDHMIEAVLLPKNRKSSN